MATDATIAVDPAASAAGDGCRRGDSVLTKVVGGWQWVRLAHLGPPSYLVLLKIGPTADEHDAVRALEWWLRSPGREDGDVVEVQ